jgi:hypothetical protein
MLVVQLAPLGAAASTTMRGFPDWPAPASPLRR